MTDQARLRILNDRPARRGRYVRYWMQASQRGPRRDSLGTRVPGNVRDLGARLLDDLPVDRSVAPVPGTPGGTDAALALLQRFTTGPLARYLRFGQVSPVRIALAVRAARAPRAAKEAFLKELVVRRELAANLALFNDRCDRYDGLPAWAPATLAAHARDPRPSWKPRAPTTRTEMPRCAGTGFSTTTSACTGARRSSSGARPPRGDTVRRSR